MRRPAALFSPRRRALTLFIGLEMVLALAIPFLAIAGYHQVLDSKAGRFIDEPDAGDPGWRAVVEPSPVTAVVETENGRTTGIALLAGHPEAGSGGAVILVPGSLAVDGRRLDRVPPDEAVTTLARTLRLGIGGPEVVDENRWDTILGHRVYLVDNPDPVSDDRGRPLLAVGPTEVGPANAALFLGRPVDGADELSLLLRRRLLWTALVADPPPADDPVAAALSLVAGPSARVVDLPLDADVATGPPRLDGPAAETLLRQAVPVPAGAQPGDRVRVRVLDRAGRADLRAVAAEVAGTGAEVVEIGNVAVFDDGPTEVLVPAGTDEQVVADLLDLLEATPTPFEADGDGDDGLVTVLVGADLGSRSG